jgi:hypothetical protein
MVHKIMCVDVGGTRIKAAILPEQLDAEMLSRQRVVVMRSLGWLNEHMPKLLSSEYPASLVGHPHLAREFSQVAVAVPGPVEDGRFRRADLNVPRELREAFSDQVGTRVTLVKDADAWIVGCDALCELLGRPMSPPAIAIVLGTGVGLSASPLEGGFQTLEIGAWTAPFPELERVAGRGVSRDKPWEVHDIIGQVFFDWVASRNSSWDHERIKMELSKRVVAFLKDVIPVVSENLGVPRTIIVGGGNEEYVALQPIRDAFSSKVLSSADLCGSAGINPDLVPLLGLHRLAMSVG